ncbi:threonine-phosphate decarboxylase CobD [Allohahella marinimesophila]|uniref:threonine-phosphate decarboxylase n=1 Tax=Allohahella marinimesophila TaxID=1054972 RepID=A0ABP7NZL1_9GAMM
MSERPVHGGRLNTAARQWGIPLDEWLDLSTGINPVSWPVPPLPLALWQRLPEDDDGLRDVIRRWASLPDDADSLPVAGSQAAIQALPRLRRPCRVGIPVPGYEEHAHCWAAVGHEVVPFTTNTLEQQLDQLDVVIWIQPNNPTGEVVPPQRLLHWHKHLAELGGWLIVDEAFVSSHASQSLAAHTHLPGLIILRSLGKFFGLAGVRAGAVLARPELCQQLDQLLGPWCLSGPTRYIMARALEDERWQVQTDQALQLASARLHDLLGSHGLPPAGGTSLFRYIRHEQAAPIANALARLGILVRLFEAPLALRFGLPATESQWQRLAMGLIHPEVRKLSQVFQRQT